MNNWLTLHKSGIHLFMEYGHSHTSNLFGYNIEVRSKPEPDFEVRIDLSPNLRTKNKQTNTYMDARDLSDGEIAELRLMQLSYNKRIFEGISQAIRSLPEKPNLWKLTICLEKDWSFMVKPKLKDSGEGSLFLYIEGNIDDGQT